MAGVHQMLLGSGASYVFKETISANVQNYNLRARALAAGWNGLAPLDAQISVAAGVVVGSSSTSSYAFDTGASFPAGSRLALSNSGYIVGAGGAGGAAGGGGNAGGPALRAQYPLAVANVGTIGGGGAGGAGYYEQGYDSEGPTWTISLGGGGGAGYAPGGGGYGASASGSPGSLTAGGAGGRVPGNAAGNGGGLGGGTCTNGNANITWLATGTRYGALG